MLLFAVDHGLFEELGKGPRSAAQLQRRTGLDAAALSAVLQSLLAWGLLERDGEAEDALYLSTRESARCLDARSPAFVRDWLRDLRQRLAQADTGAGGEAL